MEIGIEVLSANSRGKTPIRKVIEQAKRKI